MPQLKQALHLLITEKVRGLGGTLVNNEGQQFVFERESRDVESSCIIRECLERNKGIITPTGRVGVSPSLTQRGYENS